MMRIACMFLAVGLGGVACGGGDKRAEEPASEPVTFEESSDDGEVLIPAEKFEQITNTFERKATTLDRCHPAGAEAGELSAEDVVTITVGLVIQTDGKPSDIQIVERSKKSAALESCVVDAAKLWLFPTLPRPLETSHVYVLQNF